MSLVNIFFISFISVLAALILVLRVVSWATLVRHHLVADVVVTVSLIYLFSGTMSGMVIAACTGLLFSVMLSVGRALTPKALLVERVDADELG